MLKNNLKAVSNIVLLRSDKILYELISNFKDNLSNNSNAYLNSMQDFYPNSFRKDTITNSMDYTISSSDKKFTLNYEYKFLDKLFDEYFKIDGMHIYAKRKLLDKYSSLISKIHPFNVIGYKLASKLLKNELNIRNIKEFTNYITPLALSINRNYKDYADNHIHLGGSSDVALNFIALLSMPTLNKYYTKKIFESLPRVNEFSYINNGDISFGNLIDISKYCVSVINDYSKNKPLDEQNIRCEEKSQCDNKTNKSKNIISQINKIVKYDKLCMIDLDFCSFDNLSKQTKHNNMTIQNELLNEVIKYNSKAYTTKQWFVYNILLFHIHENQDKKVPSNIKQAVKIFIHCTNIIRSYMVMSQNIGLSHFSEFFGSTLRSTTYKRHNNIASNILSNGTTKVEGKISPSAIFSKEYIKYKLAFDKEIISNESKDIEKRYEKFFLNTNNSKQNYHFCVHFVRKTDNNLKQKDNIGIIKYRFDSLRNSLKEEALKLNKYLYEDSQVINKYEFYRKYHTKTIEVHKNKEYLKTKYIDLSKLITTIDIAGNENLTPPEVFAPIVKFLRRDIKKNDLLKSDFMKYQQKGNKFLEHHKLRLSVHAGEDFNHIVTGMRKVHETIKFYHMEQMDRLGHALAIGLNPKKWCENNGDIFVSKQEHLDNLIWLYFQTTEAMTDFKFANMLKCRYSKTIKELSNYIYKKDYTLDDLYKAWKLREYCPKILHDEENSLNKITEYNKSVSFDKNKLKKGYKTAQEINKKYHTSQSVRENGNKIIKIEYSKHDDMYDYTINDDDLQLYEAVQDNIIEKISQKGIIIETNPSSNVYIAYIDEYKYHPIFRWNPIEELDLIEDERFNKYGIRKSAIKVCINTDDPAIMPTTLRNEFILIKETAINANHTKNIEKMEQWAEKIRLLGLEIFDYDHKQYEFTSIE